MKRLLPLLLLLLLSTTPLQAGDDGIIVRSAKVYDKASIAARRVGNLDAGTRVIVLNRTGGWKEVYSETHSVGGWIRGYQVRQGDFAPAAEITTESDQRGFLSGLASFSRKASSFFKGGSGSTSAGTATIGVRGLSEAEIESAVADYAELEKMKQFASDRKRAKAFRKQGGLKKQKISHLKKK